MQLRNVTVHPTARSFGAYAAGLCVTASLDAAVLRYRVVLLEPLNGGPINEAMSINASGMVGGKAGSGSVNPGQHAVIWADDQVQNLDTMFNLSEAAVINDAGVIAGPGSFCPPVNGACVGVIARALPGSQFVPVGTLGGGNGEVLDINADGAFVGWWYDASFHQRAFRYTENDGVQDLSALTGFAGSGRANGINDDGEIVGSLRTSTFQQRAFVWRDGASTDLGTFGGDASEANDINAGGVIVGWARDALGMPRAFRTAADDSLLALPSLKNEFWSHATLINDAGMIAGIYYDGAEDRLFMFTDKGGSVDLGEPIDDFHPFSGPRDMNQHGAMVGMGVTNMYVAHAWFWSPDTGIRSLNDLLAPTAAFQVAAVGGINDAGQIAASVTPIGSFGQRAARLDPVAPADLTADGVVNVADLLGVITTWGSTDPVADVNGNGAVDVGDLLAVIAAWG